MKNILVIGSASVDYNMKMPRLPNTGETIMNAEFVQAFGGKGANQAVAAAKAGGNVQFVGCVGDDHIGQQIISGLRGAGVQTDGILVEQGVVSGIAMIMIGGAGENYLGVAPGANARLSIPHIQRAEKLIEQASLVIFQGESPMPSVEYAIQKAHALGKEVMWNLAPVTAFNESLLQHVAYFVVNESEASLVCGYAVTAANAHAAVAALLAKGAPVVVLTLGADGCVIGTSAGIAHTPAFAVSAVDTTAAGDVFCGAFAVSVLEGNNLQTAARFASAASAICVTRLGAQSAVPTRNEIETFLQQAQ